MFYTIIMSKITPPKKIKTATGSLINYYLTTAFEDKQRVIHLLDQKANILIGIIGIAISLFFTLFVSDGWEVSLQVFFVLGPLIISGFFAFLTIFPRVPEEAKKGSLLYFKGTQIDTTDEIVQKVSDPDSDYMHRDFIENTKILSQIIERKIVFLHISYVFLAIGLAIKTVSEIMLVL